MPQTTADNSAADLGVADSNGKPIKIGDFVIRPCINPEHGPHGLWAVHQVILQAGFPVLSYCYSEHGKVLPSGYTRGFLSDLYPQKTLLWINPGHLAHPNKKIAVLAADAVDMTLVNQEELSPPRTRGDRS